MPPKKTKESKKPNSTKKGPSKAQEANRAKFFDGLPEDVVVAVSGLDTMLALLGSPEDKIVMRVRVFMQFSRSEQSALQFWRTFQCEVIHDNLTQGRIYNYY